MCATLNEGYLRAANRGSNNLYTFLIKIEHSQPSVKSLFLVCFLLFLRLQIYGAIAAIFWQTARYVFPSLFQS